MAVRILAGIAMLDMHLLSHGSRQACCCFPLKPLTSSIAVCGLQLRCMIEPCLHWHCLVW